MKSTYSKQIRRKKKPAHIIIGFIFLLIMISGPFFLNAQTYANIWYNGDIRPNTEIALRDVIWAGSRFILVGDNGTLYISSNGSNWTKKGLMIGASDHLFGVGYDGAQTIVAVGRDQLILCSEDLGDTWTKVHDRVDNAADLYKVAYGNGTWVAIDEAGGIWTSSDGKTGWSKYNTGWSTRCLAFGNGYFMMGCAGGGAIYRSATGEQGSWANVGSLGEAVRGIAYGSNKWMAAGRNIATAGATGTGWTVRLKLADYNVIDQLYCCTIAPGTLIAAGEHGLMLNSSDGITWREGNPGTKRFIFAMTYSSDLDLVTGIGNGGPRDPNEIYLYPTHYSPKGGTPPPVITPGGGGNGSITVISPNGGELWYVGEKHTIQWASSGYNGNVNIDYSIDGRKSWMRLTTNFANRGAISWTIPATVSNSCFMKVSAVTGSPSDASNSAFSIVRSGGGNGTITVKSPNGGERWIVGQKVTITWSSTGSIGLVNVDYSIDGMATWNRLTSNYTNTGSLTWKKVANVPSANCYVRVWDTSGSPSDTSNAPFTIARSGSVGTINIIFPDGGQKWEGGSAQDITWTSSNVTGNLNIQYTIDNGSSWISVIDSTPNNGKFTWIVPETPSTRCRVKVSSIIDPAATDTSSDEFTILSGKSPKLEVNRHRFNFGYIIGSTAPTSAQAMIIANSGGKTLNWNVSCDQTWIKTDKTSGTGDAIVQVSVDPTGLAVGDYMGTLVLSDPAALNSPDLINVNLKVKESADDQVPFGEMATPPDGATVYGSIAVTGWVLDDVEVKDVKLYYNEGTYFGQSIFVEGARPDVAAAFSYFPYYYRGGWGYMLLTNSLPDGTYTITAIATDTAGKTTTFGPKTITIDNAHSVKPFGAIDTPAQGGTISGSDFKNWGWALTPLPNMIPKDGSTIQVWIDGVFKGNLNGYNGASGPIADLFPGLKNSSGPTGFFSFDTTAYPNGLHFISWTVTDDVGNTEGIGSRFFTIYNTASSDLKSKYDFTQHQDDSIEKEPSRVSRLETPVFKKNTDRMMNGQMESDILSSVVQHSPSTPSYLQITELQRVEISLGNGSGFTGYLAVGNEKEPLPVGSTLDPVKGIFSWQPGPGFMGDYELIFTGKDSTGAAIKKTVHVRIIPQFSTNN